MPQGNSLISSAVVGNKAYFLGESSTLLMTSDGGLSWVVNSPFYYPRDIAHYGGSIGDRLTFADADHAWISRGIGGLFFSTDAGATWARKDIFFEHAGAVHFSGPNHGFTTGDEYRTTDGGDTWTWTTISGPDDGFFSAFSSTDSLHVWAVADGAFYNGGEIIRTTNGGITWQHQDSGLESTDDTSYTLTAVRMRSSGVGIATGYAYSRSQYRAYGLILRTSNYGETWTRTGDPYQYTSVVAVSDSLWVLVGNDRWGYYGVEYAGAISRSTDGGITWTRVFEAPYPTPAPKTAVWIAEYQVLLAGGYHGALYRSTDLGVTWTQLGETPVSLHDISFTYVESENTSYGYAVGDQGTFMRSTDRGITWSRATINVGYPYYLLAVDGREKTVVAGGSDRTIVRSTDYGLTWSRIPTPLDGFGYSGYVINDVDVYDSLHFVATTTLPFFYGVSTHLIYTSDGGSNWSLFETPRGKMINAVALPKPTRILIAGGDWLVFTEQTGFVWTSENAGVTWDSVALPYAVDDLVMFNRKDGLALTYEKLYRTTNGGEGWDPASITWTTGTPSFWSLQGLAIASEKGNTVVSYLKGGDPNVGITGGFVVSSDKGFSWTQSEIEAPSLKATTSIANVDGLENLFMTTELGGFVSKTADTEIMYEPASIIPDGTFEANPDTLPPEGGTVTLSWSSVDADSVWINLIGPVPLNGSTELEIHSSTSLTITFSNTWGTVVRGHYLVVSTPSAFALFQNYPNPFNPSTAIKFAVPRYSEVSIKVFNLLGEEIASLAGGPWRPGFHTVEWDASGQPSGVYFYQLRGGGQLETRKMLLMK